MDMKNKIQNNVKWPLWLMYATELPNGAHSYCSTIILSIYTAATL